MVTLVLTVSLGVRCADGVGWSSNKMLSSSSLSSSSRQLGGSHSLHDRIVSSTTSKSKTLEDEVCTTFISRSNFRGMIFSCQST